MKDLAELFKILADEARLKMLWLLSRYDELCVCDIMAALEITQSKASRHLATLRRAGLVNDRKDGLWTHYSLRPPADELTRRHLEALKASLAERPEAPALLARVQEQLRNKGREALCSGDGAGAAPSAAPEKAGTR